MYDYIKRIIYFNESRSLILLSFSSSSRSRSISYLDSTRPTMIIGYSILCSITTGLFYFLDSDTACMSDYNCLVVHSTVCPTHNIRIASKS